MKPDTGRSVGVLACTLGGIAWALLGPAAVLERNNVLSYDTYNRLLVLPLFLFLVGVIAAERLIRPRTRLGTAGFVVVALGLVLLLVGNVIEFWGVLLQSKPNAQAAYETGVAEHWIGSDIGWVMFGVGMLTLIVGGAVLALSVRRMPTFPPWATLFLGLLGIGVLAGNLIVGAPFFLSIPVLGLYGAGWIALGRLLRARAGLPQEPRARLPPSDSALPPRSLVRRRRSDGYRSSGGIQEFRVAVLSFLAQENQDDRRYRVARPVLTLRKRKR